MASELKTTTESLAERISKLSPEKRALMESLLKTKKQGASTQTTITPRARTSNIAPLSYAQERVWVFDQLTPGSCFYNESNALPLAMPLDVPLLERALNEVVRRHEILRTSFPAIDGKPQQVIAPQLHIPLKVVDLRKYSLPERETEALRVATEEARQPFELSELPLLRTLLVRMGERDYTLWLTLHHIICDGWSLGIIIGELLALYEAYIAGVESPWPLPELQYADYAVWQRQWLQQGTLSEQLAYWKQQLSDLPQLHLPTDFQRPRMQSFRGARQFFEIPDSLYQSLNEMSQREGVTLFMTALTAFKVLLHRYSGQAEVVVGVPMASRNRAELELMVGFFVNTLVMRTDFSGDPTVREALSKVRDVSIGAYAHQDVPFEKLVDELHPERDLGRNPLFQVTFQLFTPPSSLGVSTSDIPLLRPSATGAAKFDLRFEMVLTREGLNGYIEYSVDLFNAETIKRMIAHYEQLLKAMIANPTSRLSELPLLTAGEEKQLIDEFNQTLSEYPRQQSIHQLFEIQVEQTPDRVALTYGEHSLSYRELNTLANRLAHQLREMGVGSESLVAVLMPRSSEMIISFLGILKAGAAYVPLDPEYPEQRLRWMIEDASPQVVIVQKRLIDRFNVSNVTLLAIEDVIGNSAASELSISENLENINNADHLSADNLAYVIYTSGSTGIPKGVMVTHQAVLRLVCNTNYIQIACSDHIAQASNSSFDAATFEIWGALLNGARLVGVSKDVLLSAAALASEIEREQISVLFVTTDLFHQLVSQQVDVFSKLRVLLFGGSLSDAQRVRECLLAGAPPALLHVYGPTESTTFATWERIRAVGERERTVTIGQGVANTTCYVLDEGMRLVPIGVAGELYLGGEGLARGYLGRAEATSERFVPDGYGRQGGARLYRTGDVVRWREGGRLEFVGRRDEQVKVRGFRVELGEVEAALREHEEVMEAVVEARVDEGREDKRLVAYVVPKKESTLGAVELRSFLREKLPGYMLPSTFVLLEALPLTPNGKVNRKALPAPDHERPELEDEYAEPRTEVEKGLAAIWAQLLGIERVGVRDNFFALGGDSILSIQLMARARQSGYQFTPAQFFQNQTIGQLAAVVATVAPGVAEQDIVMGTVPLTPVQRWFFEQPLDNPHHFNHAVLLEVREALNPALLKKAVEYLPLHHDALRLRFARTASAWEQFHAPPDASVPFTQVDLSTLPESAQREAIEAAASEAQAGLNLTEGPLVRVVLFDLGSSPSRLLVVIHHLLVDGISWRILLEDLWTCYLQLAQGDAIQLPPKTTSFKSWARRLAEHAQSPTARQELDYWLSVPGAGVSLLPTDFTGRTNTVESTSTVSVSLNSEETRALLQEVPKPYRTQINDVLLTALVVAFAKWTGQQKLFIDLEGHGREALFEDVDLSRTVGWFTTIFPVSLELSDTANLGESLKSIKEQLRSIPNHGIGYGLLRYLSEDETIAEGLRQLPSAEVSFNYLGQFGQKPAEPALVKQADESSGPTISPRNRRSHLIEINGKVVEEVFQLEWTFSENVHASATIEKLAQDFLVALRAIITHCQSPEAGGFTPSDFAKAKLSQKELDRLAAKLNQSARRRS